jgi:hypothetical protein
MFFYLSKAARRKNNHRDQAEFSGSANMSHVGFGSSEMTVVVEKRLRRLPKS